MAESQPSEGLTPEEVDLLIRLVRAPEARERLASVLRETYLNPEFWRRGAGAVKRTYFNPQVWQAAVETVRGTYRNPELWRATGEAVRQTFLDREVWRAAGERLQQTVLSPELWQAAADAIVQEYTADSLAAEAGNISEALSQRLVYAPDAEGLGQSAEDFERGVTESESEPPQPASQVAPLWWWLATRRTQAQLLLLITSLTVIDKLGRFVEDLADVDVPPELRSATEIVFAVAAFLLIYLDYRTRNHEE